MEARSRSADAEARLNSAVLATFRGPAGQLVMQWLRQSYINEILGPEASDGALRHREGQRSVVAAIEMRFKLGELGK